MSSNDSSAAQQPTEMIGKAKGKSVEQHQGGGDDSMLGDSEESSGEESAGEEPQEEVDEDNMEEINPDNIVGGRTRGKIIDWTEAEQKSKDAGDDMGDDDDDDDDEDFVDPDDDDEMKD